MERPWSTLGNLRLRSLPGGGQPTVMLVELFGIPGSGKSTLVKAASEHAAFRTRHDVSAAWDRGSIIGRAAQLVGRYADPQEMALAVRLAAAARIRDRCGLARLLRIAGKAQRLEIAT